MIDFEERIFQLRSDLWKLSGTAKDAGKRIEHAAIRVRELLVEIKEARAELSMEIAQPELFV
jgi:hypothetical protein